MMDWVLGFAILPVAVGIAAAVRVITVAARGLRTAKPRTSGKIIRMGVAKSRGTDIRDARSHKLNASRTVSRDAYRGTYLRDAKAQAAAGFGGERGAGSPAESHYYTGGRGTGMAGMSINGMGRLNTAARSTGTYGSAFYNAESPGIAQKLALLLAGIKAGLAKRTSCRVYGNEAGQGGRPARPSERERTDWEGQARMADDISKGMAHELNSLLTPIMGYSGTLRARLDENDPMRADIDEIYSSSKRAKELLQRFSERGEKTPDTSFLRLKLDETLPRIVRVAELAKPGHARIFSDIDFKGEQVMGNSAQIGQVILNLFTNAFQATKQHGGTIWIRGGIEERNSGRFARISVADDGVGIPRDNIGRIFEPFFTTKRESEGTGLGLSILREIIERHGGTVRAASAPGKSTVFIVYIPVIGSLYAKGAEYAAVDAAEQAALPGTKQNGERSAPSFADYLNAACDGGTVGDANRAPAARGAGRGGYTINNAQIGGAFFEPGVLGARSRGVFKLRVMRGGTDGRESAEPERTYTSAKEEGLRRGVRLLPRADAAERRDGATAWYGLPRPGQARAAYDGKQEPSRVIPSGIVVVDEDTWALGTVERALTSGGYGARAYPDADAAFGALLKEPCRVLIVAGRMKRSDGWTFAERARKAGCASSVIMMTDAMEEANVYGMLRSGKIDGYIKKPLAVGELMDKVGAIMDPADAKR